MFSKDTITVATFDFFNEAEFVKLLLERNRIDCWLADDNLVAMEFLLSGAIGGVKLVVCRDDAQQATEIVETYRAEKRKHNEPSDAPDIVFQCEDCHADISFPANRRGRTEVCCKCGNYVDVPE